MPAALKPSLAEKLKSLGVRPASDLQPAAPQPASALPIQSVVDGRFLPARGGETFVAEQRFAADYRHGAAPISPLPPLDMLAAWAGEARLAELSLEAFAFLDAETSGLAGGTGTYAFLVGAGRFEGGEFRLSQFFLRDPAEEPSLLEALAAFLAPARALVTFNGKAFDAPLLATRYKLHSIPLPFQDYVHLDLLPLARRLWRDRLPSRALKYLEENILMAPRTSEEVPGYEIPYLYFDYLRTGNAAPLKGVFYHNAMDVVAMAALLRHTAHMLTDPLSESIEHGLDRIALAKLFEELGRWDTAARLYERGLEQPLPEADFWQAVKRLALLQRRRGDMESAVKLWRQAAADGHIYAFVELAKYCEHHARDFSSALAWTHKAIERLKELDIPPYEHNHWMEELEHRRERLEGKAGKERIAAAI